MSEEPPPEPDQISFECGRCKKETNILEANILIIKFFNQDAQARYLCAACANNMVAAINSVADIFEVPK